MVSFTCITFFDHRTIKIQYFHVAIQMDMNTLFNIFKNNVHCNNKVEN